MNIDRFRELIGRFPGQRIVVIGDVMLDHHISGDVRRISPEAPVPVVEHRSEQFVPGGAANVARNLFSLGSQVDLVGVIGRDAAGTQLKGALRAAGIGSTALVTSPGRPTTVKTRILAGHQQMIRVDRESRQPLSLGERRKLHAKLVKAIRGAAALIVADYAKGVVDQPTMDFILSLGRKRGVPVCIDPKPIRSLRMKGCALLTPNRKETFEMAGLSDEAVGEKPAQHAALRRAIAVIRREHAPEGLIVTLGEAGMLVIGRHGVPHHLPTAARDVYDVSGAGDTVIATFALARAAGADMVEAATLANLAAGIVVGKLGTATVTTGELTGWVTTPTHSR